MAGLNKVILIGNVGKDPEVKYLEGGTAVASFSLATSESYKREGEKVTTTEWHNIVIWRKLAEVVEKYVKKGDPLYIEGKLRTRSWQDKEGNTRYTTEIVANEMIMLGRRSDDNSAQSGGSNSNAGNSYSSAAQTGNPVADSGTSVELEEESDDLPF